MIFTYGVHEFYKQTDVQRFDGTVRRNGETPRRSVSENHVACSVLIMIDAQAERDHLKVLDTPIARIPAHSGDQLRRDLHT
jgi:hypothetical protein